MIEFLNFLIFYNIYQKFAKTRTSIFRFIRAFVTMCNFATSQGTEELGHWEMLGAMLMGCLDGATCEEVRAAGMESWVVSHGCGAFPCDNSAVNWTAAYVACTGDPVADLTHNMAAEQKARAGYESVMRICDDQCAMSALQFLREREIVHFQRFGEALDRVQKVIR